MADFLFYAVAILLGVMPGLAALYLMRRTSIGTKLIWVGWFVVAMVLIPMVVVPMISAHYDLPPRLALAYYGPMILIIIAVGKLSQNR